MGLTITNTSVLGAQRAFDRNQLGLSQATNRLATGRRINTGKDDPAGLITSEQLSAAIKTLEAETQSFERANSYANISEGYTSQLSTLMNDLNGLVVSSANEAGLTDSEVAANQSQIDNIVTSIERISGDAVKSLDRFNMPDGGNAEVEALIDGAVASVGSLRSGGTNSLSSGNFDAAQAAIQSATTDVATARGQIGAYQRYTLEPRIRSNQITRENVSASRSRIADADYAAETSNRNRYTILTEANLKVLKIAQQSGASILSLLA